MAEFGPLVRRAVSGRAMSRLGSSAWSTMLTSVPAAAVGASSLSPSGLPGRTTLWLVNTAFISIDENRVGGGGEIGSHAV